MPTLNLKPTHKPTHKPIKAYYAALDQFARLGVTHESAVRAAFQGLLESCARQCGWTLVLEHTISLRRGKRIVVDGALVDDFRLAHGYWEAKDIDDDLPAEVERKFAKECFQPSADCNFTLRLIERFLPRCRPFGASTRTPVNPRPPP